MEDLIPDAPSGFSPLPFIALVLLGFVVGMGGHVYKSNTTILLGIAMIFCGTIVLPLLLFA